MAADREPADVVDALVTLTQRLPSIRRLRFMAVSRAPRLQSRLEAASSELTAFLDSAAQRRRDHGIPFWDSVLIAAEALPLGLPEELAVSATYHQQLHIFADRLIDTDFSRWLRDTVTASPSTNVIALCSEVELDDGTRAHLPMLDFAVRRGEPGAIRSALMVVKQLACPGVLLDSGRSFHFYGFDLLSPPEFASFLGRALLFSPLVDGRWLAHQLIEGSCALRVSRAGDGTLPLLVSDCPPPSSGVRPG